LKWESRNNEDPPNKPRCCTPSFEEHTHERTGDGDSDEGRGRSPSKGSSSGKKEGSKMAKDKLKIYAELGSMRDKLDEMIKTTKDMSRIFNLVWIFTIRNINRRSGTHGEGRQ
jgi:hypothetical protein